MKYTNKDIVFIINPNSGKKKPDGLIKRIKNIDSKVAIHVTKTIDDLDLLIPKIIDKYSVFVIAGGDGTINYFSKHLFNNKDKILAIIPRGSGNGYAKELGFNSNLKKLIDSIYKGDTIDTDVIEINNKKFINAAGIGFDSCVAHKFAKRSKRGLTGYFFTTLKCMRQFKNFKAKLNFDGIEIENKFKMITLANTRQFGNNALIAPKANPSSGMLDLVMVKPFPFYYYPIFIINMFSGRIKESKYISYHQIKTGLKIEANFNKFHIDGDPVIFDKTSIIKIHPQSMRVIKTNRAKYLNKKN